MTQKKQIKPNWFLGFFTIFFFGLAVIEISQIVAFIFLLGLALVCGYYFYHSLKPKTVRPQRKPERDQEPQKPQQDQNPKETKDEESTENQQESEFWLYDDLGLSHQ